MRIEHIDIDEKFPSLGNAVLASLRLAFAALSDNHRAILFLGRCDYGLLHETAIGCIC